MKDAASAQKHSQSSKHTWLDHCLCLSSDLLQVNAVIYCMFHLLVEQLLSARSQIADRLSVLLRYLWLTACIAFLRGQHVTEQLVYSKTLHAVGVSSCLMRYLCQNPCSWRACAVWAMFYTYPRSNIYFKAVLSISQNQKFREKWPALQGRPKVGWKQRLWEFITCSSYEENISLGTGKDMKKIINRGRPQG